MQTASSTASATEELAIYSADPESRRAARIRRVIGRLLPPLLVFALMVGIWYAISYLFLAPDRRFLMPPPHDVVFKGFANPVVGPAILDALGQSAIVAGVGLVVATLIGIPWGVAMARAPWIERSLFPYAVLLQCVPVLALVPLVGFWFGFGFSARVVVCAMIALFPIVSNTLFGLQSVDPQMRDLFALNHASRRQTLIKLEAPAALPAVFAGLRISAGLTVVGAIVADFFFRQGNPGLGAVISRYQSVAQGDALFAAILAAAMLGVVVFIAFGWIANRVVGSWYVADRG